MTALAATMTALADVITGHRYVFGSEDELQQQLSGVLGAAGHTVGREYRLNRTDRIDLVVTTGHGFTTGLIGIEVKVAGSTAAAVRQLTRYAAHPALDGLLLVTTRAHSLPRLLAGKPAAVVSLLGNGLA